MADSQLTPFLLDQNLIQYTTQVTQNALESSTEPGTRTQAALALEFFLSMLDPAIDNEKTQIETFKYYMNALNDDKIAFKAQSAIALENPEIEAEGFPLSAAQGVLGLPDTINQILSHISPLTDEGRNTLHSVTLTSRALHNNADRTLWQIPRDLDTAEQQIRFAFGAAISSSLSDSLGKQVKTLRIRRMAGGWNERLIVKIVQLCPKLETLLLHCGDSVDAVADPVTPAFIASLQTILSSLHDLKHLSLMKFSPTPDIIEPLQFPENAHLPFFQLESLRLYDFGWYWPAIGKGLGSTLQSLEIGLLPNLSSEQLITVARQIPSLTTLSISCFIEAEPLREFAASCPTLKYITVKQFTEHDHRFGEDIMAVIASIPELAQVTLSGVPLGHAEVTLLAKTKQPLEKISLVIGEGITVEASNAMLVDLVKSKQKTLKVIGISFDSPLVPNDALIAALAQCPKLEQILIEFAAPTSLSAGSIDALLKGCANLELTWSLETLVAGNLLYEREYREKFERAEKEREGELEADVLGN